MQYRVVAHHGDARCDIITADLPDDVDHDELEARAREIFVWYYRGFYKLEVGPDELELEIVPTGDAHRARKVRPT